MDDLPPWLADRLPDVHKIVQAIEEKKAEDRAKKAEEASGQRR